MTAIQGHITTLDLGGSEYHIRAFYEAADGTRTYLPADCNPGTLTKISILAKGLFKAHELHNNALYPIKSVNAQGLVKSDNTVVSHDFNICLPRGPHVDRAFNDSYLLADTMVNTLDRDRRDGQPQMTADAIKAQDVWNRMETLIRGEMRLPNPIAVSPQPHQPQLSSSSNPIVNPISAQPQNVIPHVQIPSQRPVHNAPPLSIELMPRISSPSNPIANPIVAQPHVQIPPQRPAHRRPILSTDLDIRNVDFTRSDWYDQISPRQMLRIISDILNRRCPRQEQGSIWDKVWKRFDGSDANKLCITLLAEEVERLKDLPQPPSRISQSLRDQADAIRESFYKKVPEENLTADILAFMAQEFVLKEALILRIREQTEAEGRPTREKIHCFVQGLTRWIDND
jgi:hypothetical protein